jgi:hypothetical protein
MWADALTFPLDLVVTFGGSQLQQRQQPSARIKTVGIEIRGYIATSRVEVQEEAVTACVREVKG